MPVIKRGQSRTRFGARFTDVKPDIRLKFERFRFLIVNVLIANYLDLTVFLRLRSQDEVLESIFRVNEAIIFSQFVGAFFPSLHVVQSAG